MIPLDKTAFARMHRYFEEYELQIFEEFGIRVKLTICLVEEQDKGEDTTANSLFIDRVIRVVANHFKYSIEQLKGDARHEDLPNARHIICHIIKSQYPKTTLRKIGLSLGGRDHSTILNSLSKFQNYYETSNAWRQQYDQILTKLNQLNNEQPIPTTNIK